MAVSGWDKHMFDETAGDDVPCSRAARRGVECPHLYRDHPEMFERLTCFIRREHDYRLRGQDGRVFLECRLCGDRSPGWDTRPVRAAAPTLRLLLDDRVALGSTPDSSRVASNESPRFPPLGGEPRLSLE